MVNGDGSFRTDMTMPNDRDGVAIFRVSTLERPLRRGKRNGGSRTIIPEKQPWLDFRMMILKLDRSFGRTLMAKRSTPPSLRSATLSDTQVRTALPKLRRRLEELAALDIGGLNGSDGGNILDSLSTKINATLRDVFGHDTLEYEEYSIETFRPHFSFYYSGMDTSLRGNIDAVETKVKRGLTTLRSIVDIFEERLGEDSEDASSRTIRAYGSLDLHREIARVANKLYQDGHYANAVEAAVKALNGLVRLRSGLEFDGTTLMERAFSPSNPVLKFNSLQDQSDKDEQKGFMQLFSGAVSGLRNPRAHGFINDDAERALEFIAFVSLLAKLLDEAST